MGMVICQFLKNRKFRVIYVVKLNRKLTFSRISTLGVHNLEILKQGRFYWAILNGIYFCMLRMNNLSLIFYPVCVINKKIVNSKFIIITTFYIMYIRWRII